MLPMVSTKPCIFIHDRIKIHTRRSGLCLTHRRHMKLQVHRGRVLSLCLLHPNVLWLAGSRTRSVGVCTAFYVGESMEEAVNTIRPAINAYYEFLGGSRPAGEWTKHGYLDIDEQMTAEDEQLDWFDFLNKRGIIVVGSADYVIEQFAEKREVIGLDHLVLMQQYTGVPYRKILASWDRLCEHVVPYFGTQTIA